MGEGIPFSTAQISPSDSSALVKSSYKATFVSPFNFQLERDL